MLFKLFKFYKQIEMAYLTFIEVFFHAFLWW